MSCDRHIEYVPKLPTKYVDPLILKLIQEMIAQRCTYGALSRRTGISAWTIRNWKVKRDVPNIANLRLCYDALNLQIVVKRKNETTQSTDTSGLPRT